MSVPASCRDCPNLAVYDWHYYYCTQHPDEKPSLRPGGGKQLWGSLTPPPDDCPMREEPRHD